MVYLDNAATTYPKPEEVLIALDNANRNAFNSGRGSYKESRQASELKEMVRKKILELNNIKSGNVVYSSSATESMNDIIFGLNVNSGDNIYVSPFEHNSIIRPLEELRKQKGINVITLPFDEKSWEIDHKKISDMFTLHKPSAIFLSQISNVTGFILPYNDIFNLASKYNSINVLDAAQGYGIVKIDNYTNIHYIVFAGHKSLYASFGIAGYIKLKNDILLKHKFGGTGSDTMNPNMLDVFPDGYEAGSTNIVAISGLNASIDWILKNDIYVQELELTRYLIKELSSIKKIKLFLPQAYNNIFGVVSIGVDGYMSEDVGRILDDEFEICVRTGYHCSPLIHEFIGSNEYLGTVRVSLSYFTTKEHIDYLIQALKTL